MKALQRWNKDCIIPTCRNPKDRRYYTKEQIDWFLGKATGNTIVEKNIAYARVSNIRQKDDLDNQIKFI